jgi:hypothetical protein
MTYLIFGLILVELALQVRALRAVVGSRQRYVALSLRRLASWLVSLSFIAEGLLDIAGNDWADAAWYLIFGIGGIVLEFTTHKNDDDWFNGRGKKIRRGLRRMFAPPRRAPAPAFGLGY